MQNARLYKAQAGIKIAGRNINNLRYADDTTIMAEIKEELKSLLMKVKEESEKAGLKLKIKKKKWRSWHLVPSLHDKWMGKQWKQWHTIFLGSKITTNGDYSHEIKRCLLLGRKAMTNLDSILKSRDITLPTKVGLVKATVFPVIMYGREICTIKKAESQRTDAFFFSFIFISWRLITLQHCSGFCHTLKWISHGFTCIPHPGPPSHLPTSQNIRNKSKNKQMGPNET